MARLATFVHVADSDGVTHVFGPDDEVPAWAAQAITNPKAWADPTGTEEGTSPGPRAAAYRGMKISDLRAEIDRRNADRAEEAKLPAEGTKADLAAVLEADDDA